MGLFKFGLRATSWTVLVAHVLAETHICIACARTLVHVQILCFTRPCLLGTYMSTSADPISARLLYYDYFRASVPLGAFGETTSRCDVKPSIIMHDTSTATPMLFETDEARWRGMHGRSKDHAIHGACTR
jgi:hypothetical protein